MGEFAIEAAGGLPWRLGATAAPEVAVVHRPRYDDWSLPKGKLDPGEHVLRAALREVAEETGLAAVLGRPLGETHYLKGGAPKRVRYWAMRVDGGAFAANPEVDRLAWLPVGEARDRLTHDRDRAVVDRFAADPRPTWPVLVLGVLDPPAGLLSAYAVTRTVGADALDRAIAGGVATAVCGVAGVTGWSVLHCARVAGGGAEVVAREEWDDRL